MVFIVYNALLYSLFHLILLMNLWGRYFPCFTDEENGPREIQGHWLVGGKTKSKIQAFFTLRVFPGTLLCRICKFTPFTSSSICLTWVPHTFLSEIWETLSGWCSFHQNIVLCLALCLSGRHSERLNAWKNILLYYSF